MKDKVIDYIKNMKRIPISPIWGGEKDFPFLCLGHLEIANAMGFELEQVTPVLKIVKEGQMTSFAHLRELQKNKEFNNSWFEKEIATLQNIKKQNPEKICGGGCFGPLTVVSDILGAENLLREIVKQKEFVKNFVEYTTDYLVELAKKEVKAGADFFWIAEPMASLLSPERFWEFSGLYLKRIYEAAEVPGFLHVCGKTLKHTKYMENTTAQVLSIDSCTDIAVCIRMVKDSTVIMGNVSPSTLRFGTKEEVEKEVNHILTQCRGFTNFILSTGCSVMEETPEENVRVMFEMVRNRKK